MRRAMELEKLEYYGASYGTILGMTYAQLFPSNVGRMALTGNCDITSWFDPAGDPRAKYDAEDEAFATYYKSCHSAGPELCPLWDVSVDTIRAKFEKANTLLLERPMVLSRNVTFSSVDFHGEANDGFYGGDIPQALQIAAELLSGQPGPYLQDFEQKRQAGMRRDATSDQVAMTSFFAILCADSGGFLQHPGMDYLQREVDDSIAIAQPASFHEPKVGFRLMCQAANLPAVARPKSSQFRNISTSNPILFIGNTADAVTPLFNAQQAHQHVFPDSGLLTVDGTGHSGSADPQRLCAKRWITPYFATGELPPEGTVCDGNQDEVIAKDFEKFAKELVRLENCVARDEFGECTDPSPDDGEESGRASRKSRKNVIRPILW